MRVSAGASGGRAAGRLLLALLVLILGFAPRPAAAQTGGVFGFVFNTSGQPISGALIREVSGPNVGANTTSAQDGSYAFAGLTVGTHVFAATQTGFNQVQRTVQVLNGDTIRIDFTLSGSTTGGGTLQGVITRSGTGDLIPGALVSLSSGTTSASQTTDSSGFYQFTGLPTNSYTVRVTRTGYNTLSRSGVTVHSGSTVQLNLQLTIRTADLGTLAGRVTSTSGAGIPNAQVTLLDGASRNATATADSQGNYLIRFVVPDTYTVQFQAAGFTSAIAQNVTVTSAQQTVLNQTLAPASTANATLQGVVTDSFGTIIEGARVEVVSGPATGAFDISDATGFYQISNLPAGTFTLLATATGFADLQQLVTLTNGQTLQLNISLTANVSTSLGTITGRVTDPNGAGLAGVLVRVTAGPTAGPRTTTGNDGRYALRNLPAGTYALTFHKDGFSDVTVTGVVVVAGQTVEVNVQLGGGAGGGTLSGTVRSSTGTLLQGVLVEVLNGSQTVTSTTTAANGTYSLPGIAAGTYSVRFSLSGFQTATQTGIQISAGATTTLNQTLTAGGTGTTGTLTGVVTSTNGGLLQGTLVEVLNGSQTIASGTAGATGAYTITGITPGTYSVRFSLAGFQTATQTGVQITAGGTTTLNQTLTASGTGGTGSLSGLVSDTAGNPLPGALVEVLSGSFVVASGSTGTDGRYSITGIPVGTYAVRFTLTGFVTTTRVSIPITQNSITTLNQTLTAGGGGGIGTVTGTVVDATGQPIQGASVTVSNASFTGTATTDANGAFTINNVPAGTDYRVRVTATGFVPGDRSPVTVTGGGTTQLSVTLVPQVAGAQITGIVLSTTGRRLPGAQVVLTLGSRSFGSRSTNGSGQFTFTGIAPGSYTLTTSLSGFITSKRTALVRGGNIAVSVVLSPVR